MYHQTVNYLKFQLHQCFKIWQTSRTKFGLFYVNPWKLSDKEDLYKLDKLERPFWEYPPQ